MAKYLSDGCISPTAYEHAPAKIVHLLKHGVTHQNPDGYESLITMIRNGHDKYPDSLAPVWTGCARRAYCIFNAFPAWGTIDALSVRNDLWPAFEKTAVVNVVKETGASSTDRDQFAEDSQTYWKVVLDQLSQLSPDIVICGGTFQVWSNAASPREVMISPSGIRYAVADEAVYLDAYHPSHRVKHEIEYAFFRAGSSEICPQFVRDNSEASPTSASTARLKT